MTEKSLTKDSAGIVEVEGAQLRYRIEGHGPPCLVVGSSVCYPRVFSRELRERMQLVFADLRHFTDPRHFVSADPSFRADRISIDTCADDVDQVRQALGLGDVVVMGHSMHGRLALEYARRYPEHVRGVVVIGDSPCGSHELLAEIGRLWEADASDERKEILARRLAELTPQVRARLSAAEVVVRDYVATGPMKCYDPTYDCSWLLEEVVPDVPVFERLNDLLETYDLAQGPTEISVPVLIAAGRYDYSAPYALWEKHRHKLPKHTYVLFEASAHFPPLEEPQRFDQTLLTWADGL
jgi:proline iminopeptidase